MSRPVGGGMPKFRARLQWTSRFSRAAAGLLLISIIAGCSTTDVIVNQHEKMCKDNVRIIIKDEKLWDVYRKIAEINYRKRSNNSQYKTEKMIFESVDGFEVKFGVNKSWQRSDVHYNKIMRDDVFLVKNNAVVVQLVDYVLVLKGIGGPSGFDCLGFYNPADFYRSDS